MRTLTTALTTALGAAVQRPAWLVEIGLTSTLRLSSFGTVSWDSQTWTAADVNVASLKVGALKISGSIVFGNADDTYGAIALTEGFTDKRIRIWGYDAGAISATADAVLVADAVGAGAEIGPTSVRVGLRDACEYKVGPRAVITPAYGFNTLLPAGRTITINGTAYTLERR